MQSPKREIPEKARRHSLFEKDLIDISQEQLNDVSMPVLMDASLSDSAHAKNGIQSPRKNIPQKVRKPRPFGDDFLQFSEESDSSVEATASSYVEKPNDRIIQTPQRKSPQRSKRQFFPETRISPTKQLAFVSSHSGTVVVAQNDAPDDEIFDLENIPPKNPEPPYKVRRQSLFEKDLVEMSEEELVDQAVPFVMQFDLLESSDSSLPDYKFLDGVNHMSSKTTQISPSVISKIKESKKQFAHKTAKNEGVIQNEKPSLPGSNEFVEELNFIIDEFTKYFK